jgi:glycosyltransferase involved in cell wall biosynthesis
VSYASKIMMQQQQLFKGKKISVVHNGIERIKIIQAKINFKIDPDKINIAVVARLETGKGHEIMINALKLINQGERKKIRVHFIGGGSQEEFLRGLISKNNLKNTIIFWGERDDVRQILPQFDFLVLPSLSENFPFAILEAFAASLPVIASNVGGIKEAVQEGKGGFLVPPGDNRILAEKIIYLSQNPQLRTKMGIFNYKFSELHFSDKIMATKIEEIYEHAIAEYKRK